MTLFTSATLLELIITIKLKYLSKAGESVCLKDKFEEVINNKL